MEGLDLIGMLNYWVLAVGVSSIVLKGLEFLAAQTKTKKDDLWVGRARKVVTVIGQVLHFLALSPKDQKVLIDKELNKDDE